MAGGSLVDLRRFLRIDVHHAHEPARLVRANRDRSQIESTEARRCLKGE
jgi:hypothetical protein